MNLGELSFNFAEGVPNQACAHDTIIFNFAQFSRELITIIYVMAVVSGWTVYEPRLLIWENDPTSFG